MTSDTFTRWLGVLLAAVLLSWASLGFTDVGTTGKSGDAPVKDPRLDMITALKAIGPHPSLGDHAQIFGRLVGTWEVEYTDFSRDGKASHRTGEFILGWVMDGRAIEDLWIVDPSGTRTEREVYSDLRYFDPKSGTWPAIFVDPEHVSFARFTGGAVGDDRIVLVTHDLDGKQNRWSFSDIRPDSFAFRDEASNDGGNSWKLRSEYHMKRRGATLPVQ